MTQIKIAIIDADLIGRPKHRFPNLACMKISAYYKLLGYDVELITTYGNTKEEKEIEFEKLKQFDKISISKVFEETVVPEEILKLPNVEYGGDWFLL